MSRRSLTDRLASPVLAAWLMAALMLMSILNVLVPQKTYMAPELYADFTRSAPVAAAVAEAIGLNSVFGGWMIAAVAALLAANVALCTYLRLRRRYRHWPIPGAGRAKRSVWRHDADVASLLTAAADALTAQGWRVRTIEEEGLLAVKGGSGFWGSIVLHAGLLTVIVGGALSVLTSFSGTAVIAEGQTISDSRTSYLEVLREPALGSPYSDATVTLDRMEFEYESGIAVDVVAHMTSISEGDVVAREVRVNHPLDISGKSFLLQDSGFAPSIVVTLGDQSAARVVNLAEKTPFGWRDSLELGEVTRGRGVAVLELTATPVPLAAGAEMPDEVHALRSPRLQVGLVEGGSTTWRATLGEGESAESAGGLSVEFEELRTWTRFRVRSSPARWLVYTGFWMCAAGVAVRVAVPERRAWVRAEAAESGYRMHAGYASRPWGAWDRAEEERTLDELCGDSRANGVTG